MQIFSGNIFFLSKYALNGSLKLIIKVIHWRKWAMFPIREQSKFLIFFLVKIKQNITMCSSTMQTFGGNIFFLGPRREDST